MSSRVWRYNALLMVQLPLHEISSLFQHFSFLMWRLLCIFLFYCFLMWQLLCSCSFSFVIWRLLCTFSFPMWQLLCTFCVLMWQLLLCHVFFHVSATMVLFTSLLHTASTSKGGCERVLSASLFNSTFNSFAFRHWVKHIQITGIYEDIIKFIMKNYSLWIYNQVSKIFLLFQQKAKLYAFFSMIKIVIFLAEIWNTW